MNYREWEETVPIETCIIKLLLTMVPDQRGQLLREESEMYRLRSEVSLVPDEENLDSLLEAVPMP